MKPPAHLSSESRRVWRRVLRDFSLDVDAILLLRTALEAYDRAQQARQMIDRDGLVLDGRRHPALTVERDSGSLFLRAWRALDLDLELPRPPGRPAGS